MNLAPLRHSLSFDVDTKDDRVHHGVLFNEPRMTTVTNESLGVHETAPSEPCVGELVELRRCYPSDSDPPLTTQQRAAVIEYARRFEECYYSADELHTLDDRDLIAAAYSAMADYARGQM